MYGFNMLLCLCVSEVKIQKKKTAYTVLDNLKGFTFHLTVHATMIYRQEAYAR